MTFDIGDVWKRIRRRKEAQRQGSDGEIGQSEQMLLMSAFPTSKEIMQIVPAWPKRSWMDSTPSAFANRCLPLLMANQWGWFIVNDCRIEVLWNGGQNARDLHIRYSSRSKDVNTDPVSFRAVSHFGNGILTWKIPYLFTTPHGWNLYVRGPANWCKDGVAPLDGVVETDCSSAPFTMNVKITRADTWIVFEEGEPICMTFPMQRRSISRFNPEIRPLADNPSLEQQYREWEKSRDEFNRKLNGTGPGTEGQRHYFKGMSVLGRIFQDHQTKVAVPKFTDLRANNR